MYTENPVKDVKLFSKAFLSNQIARFAPKLYVNLTHQTGRGDEDENAEEIAKYFIECFRDYQTHLGVKDNEINSYLNGKVILEYGPGDILGVALLFYAHGAQAVQCVDRFPLSKMSATNIAVYSHLLESLGKKERERAEDAFNEKGIPESGFKQQFISYKVTKNGLSGENNKYDLIISRAVLEHVNDLKETFLDMKQSMKANGVSLHKVDLNSHGLDRYTEFDFLTWPKFIYHLMYSHKGFPNRWRVNKYKDMAEQVQLQIKELKPTKKITQEKLSIIRSKLDKEFRNISSDELTWLGFWIRLEHG